MPSPPDGGFVSGAGLPKGFGRDAPIQNGSADGEEAAAPQILLYKGALLRTYDRVEFIT